MTPRAFPRCRHILDIRRPRSARILAVLLGCSVLGANVQAANAEESQHALAAGSNGATMPYEITFGPQIGAEELDQLTAPIALYPDQLVAQILAASTFPAEVVEADRWMQQHSTLKGVALAQAVDQQPWDPSVKALTQFAALLANMDQNLSWTAALGEAYAKQPQAVLNAVQAMRRRAQQAGTLQSSPQETVTTDGEAIAVEPASPETVYVPEYDPWLAYGDPVDMYPGWDPFPGLFLDGPGLAWGLGLGVFAGFGWGWHHWHTDWHHHRLDFNHQPYGTHTTAHPNMPGHGPDYARTNGFNNTPVHSPALPHDRPTVLQGRATVNHMAPHSEAFGGFNHGGVTRPYSFRGTPSPGGFHAGFAGGFHGGGFGGHR